MLGFQTQNIQEDIFIFTIKLAADQRFKQTNITFDSVANTSLFATLIDCLPLNTLCRTSVGGLIVRLLQLSQQTKRKIRYFKTARKENLIERDPNVSPQLTQSALAHRNSHRSPAPKGILYQSFFYEGKNCVQQLYCPAPLNEQLVGTLVWVGGRRTVQVHSRGVVHLRPQKYISRVIYLQIFTNNCWYNFLFLQRWVDVYIQVINVVLSQYLIGI